MVVYIITIELDLTKLLHFQNFVHFSDWIFLVAMVARASFASRIFNTDDFALIWSYFIIEIKTQQLWKCHWPKGAENEETKFMQKLGTKFRT